MSELKNAVSKAIEISRVIVEKKFVGSRLEKNSEQNRGWFVHFQERALAL
jgi:hypothetical protein